MCEIYTLPIGRSIALYRDSRTRPLLLQRPPLTRSTNQHLHATPCHARDAAPWLQDTIGDTIGFHCLIAQISVTRRPDAPTPILRPHVNGAPSRTSAYDDCVHFERSTCRRIAGCTTTESDWFQFGMRPPQADMTPAPDGSGRPWRRPGASPRAQRSRRTPRDRRRPAATHPAPHRGHHDAGRPVTGRAAEKFR
jgi:hypothetical protein